MTKIAQTASVESDHEDATESKKTSQYPSTQSPLPPFEPLLQEIQDGHHPSQAPPSSNIQGSSSTQGPTGTQTGSGSQGDLGDQTGQGTQTGLGHHGGPGNPGGPAPPLHPSDFGAFLNSIFTGTVPIGPLPPNVGPLPPHHHHHHHHEVPYPLNLYAPARAIWTVPQPDSEFADACCEHHQFQYPKYKVPSNVNFGKFPPEIREHIYSYILPDSFGLRMPPFIVALRAAQPEIYHEALAFFSKHNTFRLSNENTWSCHDMGKTAIKSIEKLKVDFGGLLVNGSMQLYPHIGPDERILKPYNPKEVHLDATSVPWELSPIPEMLALPAMKVFKNLERLLITIPHPNVVPHPEDHEMWDDDFEEIKVQNEGLKRSIRFLNLVLGVKAKLWAVSVGNPNTWFWKAPKGKNLVWNKQKAEELHKKERVRRAFEEDTAHPEELHMEMLNHALTHHWHGPLPPHVQPPFLGSVNEHTGPPVFGPPPPPSSSNNAHTHGSGSATAATSAATPSASNIAASGTATTIPAAAGSTTHGYVPDQSANEEWETEPEDEGSGEEDNHHHQQFFWGGSRFEEDDDGNMAEFGMGMSEQYYHMMMAQAAPDEYYYDNLDLD